MAKQNKYRRAFLKQNSDVPQSLSSARGTHKDAVPHRRQALLKFQALRQQQPWHLNGMAMDLFLVQFHGNKNLGYGGVLKRGVSQNRWFTMENPSKMDENG